MQPAPAASRSERTDLVVNVIAELTRYPRSIIRTDAYLEEDLGIDSVKRAEILSVLRSRLELPLEAAALAEIRTIGDIVAAVERLAGTPAASGRTASTSRIFRAPAMPQS